MLMNNRQSDQREITIQAEVVDALRKDLQIQGKQFVRLTQCTTCAGAMIIARLDNNLNEYDIQTEVDGIPIVFAKWYEQLIKQIEIIRTPTSVGYMYEVI